MKLIARIGLSVSLLVSITIPVAAQNPIITTYVGPTLPSPGAQAILQSIDGPTSAIPDGSGGLYITSFLQNRVYRVGANGALSIIAGNVIGSSGDGGPAAAANLSGPSGLALDASGNLYIADSVNNRVRKVTADGVISTIAGDGTPAQLNFPTGLAVDFAGNLYIADTLNNRIRKLSATGAMTTVAGDGSTSTLNRPRGVAIDAAGNLYIADTLNSRIRKVALSGTTSTIVGTGTAGFAGDGGAASAALLNQPAGVAVDALNNLYVADTLNHRVRKVSSAGSITTVAGSGTPGFSGDGGAATLAQLSFPSSIAVDSSGMLDIADNGNNRVRIVSLFGVIGTAAGNGTQGTSGESVSQPRGIAIDSSGAVYIADSGNHRIRKVTGGVITTIAGNGIEGFSGDNGPAVDAQLSSPTAITLDGARNLYIVDSGNNRVRKVTASGVITTVAGNGTLGFGGNGGKATDAQLNGVTAVAVDSANNLYIADAVQIHKVSSAGVISVIAGTGFAGFVGDGGPATSAAINKPLGLALDPTGNLYVADTGNNRIRKITSLGLITTVAGTSANLNAPSGISVDAAGNVYIADSGNNRIRKMTGSGVVTNVAGNGSAGFGGDRGPADQAQLYSPSAVVVETIVTIVTNPPTGTTTTATVTTSAITTTNVYIADTLNHRVRKVTDAASAADPSSYTISNFGGVSLTTAGNSGLTTVGYGRIQPNSGNTTPSGMAIFGFRQSNILVSEAGVPASPLIQSGRIYAEINGPVNTGIAIANPGSQQATISFYFTGPQGNFGAGTTTIGANGQLAAFLNQSPFNGGSSINGTFTFTSTTPVSVVALRGFTNERSEFLITTLPVGSMSSPLSGTVVFPHFADGGGWKTQIVLVNPTDGPLSGAVQFLDRPGGPLATYDYSIAPRTSQKITTPGVGPQIQAGSVRVIPSAGTPRSIAPSGVAIFSFRRDGVTVTEAGVAAAGAGSAFRLYAEIAGDFDNLAAGSIQTGLAISNLSNAVAAVTLQLMRMDGSFTGLTGGLTIPPNGQVAAFLNQIDGLQGVPRPFQGVLRVSSVSPIAVTGLRGRYNERTDFLITTTPPTDEASTPSTSEMVFPHFADAGGYSTQFILFSGSAGQFPAGQLRLFSQTGQVLTVNFQ